MGWKCGDRFRLRGGPLNGMMCTVVGIYLDGIEVEVEILGVNVVNPLVVRIVEGNND